VQIAGSTVLRLAVVGISCLWQIPVAGAPPDQQTPVAIISGQPIYDDELATVAAAQLSSLYRQEYQIKKDALENLVNRKLLDAEASRKGVPPEKLLEMEVDAKLADPTDAELRAYYLGQKDRLNRPYEEIEAQLRAALKQSKVQQGRQDYIAGLRKTAGVTILLRPAKVDVTADPARLRGDAKAPVTIVEFSDYQCPYCQAVESTLKQVLAKYEGQVGLAYRDFPLTQIHPQAQLAAEAAHCAAEQGRFWEYHDLLFANQSMLEQAGLVENAKRLGLDETRFDGCLNGRDFRSAVEADQQSGLRAGVTGTPAFFINGIYLNGNQPASEFARIIDDELEAIRLRTQAADLLTRKEDKRKKN
jgi:protein-disulfide isomerase